ncbi:MAG: superoxide dismutase [Thermonemataceae bacterium]
MKKRTFLKISATFGAGVVVAPSLVSCNEEASNDTDATGEAAAATLLSFELPKLPYPYDALVAAVDEETMTIHHQKHHQGYVNKLNKAIQETKTEASSLEDLLAKTDLPEAIRNNGGGHFNHSLFWEILAPDPVQPSKTMDGLLSKDFGSVEGFKKSFTEAAGGVFGSGWAWLCLGDDEQLFITTTPNQDNPLMSVAEKQGKPLMGIDVWEHAYYLRYQNERGQYLQKILERINWEAVENNLG